MTWEANLSPQAHEALRAKNPELPAVPDDGGRLAENISIISQRAPWLTPETTLALARSNASVEAIDAVGYMSGIQAVEKASAPSPIVAGASDVAGKIINAVGFSWRWGKKLAGMAIPDQIAPPLHMIGDGLYDFGQMMKPVSRPVLAALDTIPQMVQQGASRAFDRLGMDIQFTEEAQGGYWESTSIGQYLANPEERGEGFIISEDMREAQSREARARRGTLNGSAFTIGRGVAQTFSTPDSLMYNTVSGLLDATVMLTVPDPTKYVSKGIKAAKTAIYGTVPMITKADIAASKVDEALEGLMSAKADLAKANNPGTLASVIAAEAGLSKSLTGGNINIEKFIDFMQKKPLGRALVKLLTVQDDAGKIFSDTFRGDVPLDVARNLAKATTEEQVIASLLEGYGFAASPMQRRLDSYLSTRPMRMVGATPARALVKRSRLLAEVPDRVIVTGDARDNMKALKSMILSLRAAAVPHKSIQEFTTEGVEALSTGSGKTAVYDLDKLYDSLITRTLTQNKVKQEAIDNILTLRGSAVDIMRSYFKNRLGEDTDNGWMLAMLNIPSIKAGMTPAIYNDLLQRATSAGGGAGFDLAFNSAIQHSDLMNRARVLPDPRELRRLTRNPLFSRLISTNQEVAVGGEKVIQKVAVVGKIPVMSKRRSIEIITDRIKHIDLEAQIGALRKAHGGPGMSPAIRKQIDDLVETQKGLREPRRIKTGEQRALITLANLLQNGIWKTFTLITGGYYIRNAIDAQMRMAFGGVGNRINHPFEYMSLVIGRTNRRGITGDDLMGGGWANDPEAAINKMTEELRDRLSSAGRVRGMSSADVSNHLRKLGTYANVSRATPKNGMVLHTDGVIQQLGKIQKDPLSQIVVKMRTAGRTDDDIVAAVVKKMRNDPKIHKEMRGRFLQGVEEINPNDGQIIRFAPFDIDNLPAVDQTEVLSLYVNKIVLENVNVQAGRDDVLHFVAAYDRTPFLNGRDLERTSQNVKNLKAASGASISPGNLRRGDEVILPDGRKGVVVSTFNKRSDGVIVPFKEAGTLAPRGGTPLVQGLVRGMDIYSPATGKGLPRTVSRELNGRVADDFSEWQKMDENMNQLTSWFFGKLNERPIRYLERSPTFRHFYYETIGENIDEMSTDAAKTLLVHLNAQAKHADMDVAKYIGNSSVVKKLEKISNSPSHTGTLTTSELDDYAKLVGLSKMEDLLFDASNTNNLKDILRIIMPFGNAWSEVIGHYLGAASDDAIHMYRTFQRIYSGLSDADPDNDGRGFFYEDPQTGETMFSFPFSGALSKLVTGGDYSAALAAPVKRLSQGINVMPALGPMAQVLASTFIKETPDNDELLEFLLPYGGPKGGVGGALIPVPGWATKMYEALEADTSKTHTIFGNTYFETLKAEHNSGQYDLSQPGEDLRLKEAAKSKAKWLTAMRALSQFAGPTAATLQFKVPTDAGDKYTRVMIKEFHDMQQEDYDSSVERFLKLHGENAALYVSSKSKAKKQGLETTDDFGDWERGNRDLISAFPRVANYLAPSFGEFDFRTQARQLAAGDREALNDDEMIALAQNRIGSSRYRAAKLIMGAYPTKAEAEILSEYRLELNRKYPGFKAKAEFITNQYANDLLDLARLVNDPRVAWNPATPTIKEYMALRAEVISASGLKTLKAKSLAPQRAELFRVGMAMARTNPFFDRIWQRLLSEEVED